MAIPSILSSETNPAISSLKADETNTSSATKAGNKLQDDFDNFMLLLTTQLKNQDPTEPLDTNEFTSQLVQFTEVEQSIDINKNLEALINQGANQQINSAVSFIGKTVESTGNSGFLENGAAEFSYEVPLGASEVTIAVLDTNNQPVFSGPGKSNSGRHVFEWDGVNSFNGASMPDGQYTFGLLAKNANGESVDGKIFSTGKVTSVSLDSGEMKLSLNGQKEIGLDQVLSVRETKAQPQIAALVEE